MNSRFICAQGPNACSFEMMFLGYIPASHVHAHRLEKKITCQSRQHFFRNVVSYRGYTHLRFQTVQTSFQTTGKSTDASESFKLSCTEADACYFQMSVLDYRVPKIQNKTSANECLRQGDNVFKDRIA